MTDDSNELHSALRVFRALLDHNGMISRTDQPELFDLSQQKEIRELLEAFEQELSFHLLKVQDRLYLIPDMENTTLGFSMREYREDISPSARAIDALTVSYVQMYLCWEFYHGKNASDPTVRTFIRMEELLKDVDALFDRLRKSGAAVSEIDASSEMNFELVAETWQNRLIEEENSRSSKAGIVRVALNQMIAHGLLMKAEDEYRPTRTLHDKFIYYYLDSDRVQEIHAIFDEMSGGDYNAEN